MLPPEVQRAIIDVKNNPRGGLDLQEYKNKFGAPGDGPPLPKVSAGNTYREKDVGAAHPNDSKSGRGKRRLVFEVNGAGRIQETYYSEAHYAKGSFTLIN